MKGVKGFQVGRIVSKETRDKISKALSRKVKFNCDNCGSISFDKPSSYKRKVRHFCNRYCYSEFIKTKLPRNEQNAYKGGGMSNEEKAIRVKARSDLNHAIRDNRITRLPCEICGNEKSEAHHYDYNLPLDVKWLCDKHHHEEHTRIHQNPELLCAKK